MLRTRLWMGAVLIGLAVAILFIDSWFQPWYPLLLVTSLTALTLACQELLTLLRWSGYRRFIVGFLVAGVVLANWPAHIGQAGNPWQWIGLSMIGSLIALLLVEAAVFRPGGETLDRLGGGFLVVGYLGLLPGCFLQLRWLPGDWAPFALAVAVFVPKVGDIGAYTVGRLLGRRRFAPVLSPKKSWEGAVGGVAAAVATALALNAFAGYATANEIHLPWWSAALLGLVLGVLGLLGDLAESLIKRACEQKDASTLVPGFGGVLDVLDSILLSAPAAYLGFVLLV